MNVASAIALAVGGLAWTALTASLTRDQQASEKFHATLDHVILGVSDLDRGRRAFEVLTGVPPKPGGRHPRAGTRNALVSLGELTYLEIIAPDPEVPAGGSRARLSAFANLTPFGWAIGTTNMAAAVARLHDLGFETGAPGRGSRVQPDGLVLSWTSVSVRLPETSYSPFFIEWSRDTRHPASTSPPGCRLEALIIRDPQPAALLKLVAELPLDVSVRPGPPAMGVALRCPKGRVEFGERGLLDEPRHDAAGYPRVGRNSIW